MAQAAPSHAPPLSDETFAGIAAIAYDIAGLSLPPTKRDLVAARIAKRLSRLALSSYDEYLALITDPEAPERARMVAALTTNVSTFFREAHHFEALTHRILPPLLDRARRGARLRIWSAGAAHGQEAYSIAMTLLALEPRAASLDIRILGTDIDGSVIRAAALGTYHAAMLTSLDEATRRAHFSYDASADTYLASPDLRALTIFRELNLHGPWPMPGRFDVIFCRNVVIYFDARGQNALWARLAEKLAPKGWLLVGHSERVPKETAPRLIPRGHTIYQIGDGAKAARPPTT